MQVEELLQLRWLTLSGVGAAVHEVQTGAEAAAGAGEDDRAHLGVAVRLDEETAHRAQHFGADRVHAVGAV